MKPQTPQISLANHIVTQRLRVRPSFISRMRVIARELVSALRAEDDCLSCLAAESLETEGLFLISSAWRDKDAYEQHRTSPYVRAFESQIVPEILREPAKISSWQKIA
jgi:quinol monooxygenase YgiN